MTDKTPVKSTTVTDKEKLAFLRQEYKKQMLELERINKIALKLEQQLEEKFDDYEQMELQLKEQSGIIKELVQKIELEKELNEDALLLCGNKEKITLTESERKKLNNLLNAQDISVPPNSDLKEANLKLRMQVIELTQENERLKKENAIYIEMLSKK